MIEHPLTPLTADEISTAASCVKAQSGLDDNAFFETITLDEPDHDEMAAFRANGARPARRAYVCCYERSSNRTLRGVVDLGAERLVSWDHVPGVQARIPPEEFVLSDAIAKADPRVVEALAKRGITDLSKVLIETWAPGNFGHADEVGKRLAYCHCWVINEAGDNRYGRPIANLPGV